ncbi:hypothetical protein EDB87DRAFT_620883 [Lactarius vividus]|nr:hypothetical protein EDB87DRAFT_620883 [Lactarius vividus]
MPIVAVADIILLTMRRLMRRCTPLHSTHIPSFLPSPTPITAQVMATPSSRFQAIFQAALKSYQKQTKNDLIAHPLASQLQSCNSISAILSVLQHQVREFDQAHSGDERLTKWLVPTVNVLYFRLRKRSSRALVSSFWPPRMLQRVKILSQSSLNASDIFSIGSKLTQK